MARQLWDEAARAAIWYNVRWREKYGTRENQKTDGDAEAAAREGGDEAVGTKTYANEWLQERNEF